MAKHLDIALYTMQLTLQPLGSMPYSASGSIPCKLLTLNLVREHGDLSPTMSTIIAQGPATIFG
jgi:hypothetical protein